MRSAAGASLRRALASLACACAAFAPCAAQGVTPLSDTTLSDADAHRIALVLDSVPARTPYAWQRNAVATCLVLVDDTGRVFRDTAHAYLWRIASPLAWANDCPGEYSDSFTAIDSLGHPMRVSVPERWVHPNWLTVSLPVGSGTDWIVEAAVDNGLSFQAIRCRGSGGRVKNCALTETGIR
jgi:hypothetical protein